MNSKQQVSGDFSENQSPVLKMWSFEDAPDAYQARFPAPAANSWIAYVPAELSRDPVVALLSMNAAVAGSTRRVVLSDGNILFAGLLCKTQVTSEVCSNGNEQSLCSPCLEFDQTTNRN